MIRATNAFPFRSVGVIQIQYFDEVENAHAVATGTVYFFSIPGKPHRNIVLGAGHNLIHLINDDVSAVKVSFGNSFACFIAKRNAWGGYRVAVSGKQGTYGDYGVAVLDMDVPETLSPIPLQKVVDVSSINVVVAGCLAGNTRNGDFGIWQNTVNAKTDTSQVIDYAVGTTVKGMSGGPVILDEGEAAKAIGIIGGDGTVGGQDRGLAKAIDDDTISDILGLIDKALS